MYGSRPDGSVTEQPAFEFGGNVNLWSSTSIQGDYGGAYSVIIRGNANAYVSIGHTMNNYVVRPFIRN